MNDGLLILSGRCDLKKYSSVTYNCWQKITHSRFALSDYHCDD